jgi:hypothetical protein
LPAVFNLTREKGERDVGGGEGGGGGRRRRRRKNDDALSACGYR